MLARVDFPNPEGPMIGDKLAPVHTEVHAFQAWTSHLADPDSLQILNSLLA
jgi:hypothetical protein